MMTAAHLFPAGVALGRVGVPDDPRELPRGRVARHVVELRELGFGGLRIDDIIERTEGRLRLREWLGLHRQSAPLDRTLRVRSSAAWAGHLRGGLETLEFAGAYARALGHRG